MTHTEAVDIILRINHISKSYPMYSSLLRRSRARHHVLNDISFSVNTGETLAIVGASGSGKSTLARLILGLEKPSAGQVFYQNIELTALSYKEIRPLKRLIQIVFQDPSSALNAKFKAYDILKEPLNIHYPEQRAKEADTINDILEKVGLDPSLKNRYLHELSGGQRQRLAIARSIILKPKLLILDEPLSALDVSLQRQLIALLESLQKELQLTIILISHDLNLVKHFSTRVAVLYDGKLETLQATSDLFTKPQIGFTKTLLDSL